MVHVWPHEKSKKIGLKDITLQKTLKTSWKNLRELEWNKNSADFWQSLYFILVTSYHLVGQNIQKSIFESQPFMYFWG